MAARMNAHHPAAPPLSETRRGLVLLAAPPAKGGESLRLPVRLTSISAAGVLLACDQGEALPVLGRLPGGQAALHLPQGAKAGLQEIPGRIAWVRTGERRQGEAVLGFELKKPDPEARRLLEGHLEAYPTDIKSLWDSWDDLQRTRSAQMAEQAAYLVAAGAMAAGLTLHLAGPESLRLYGSILALYGCVMMAGKSLWTMWRTRVASRQ